MTVNFGNTVFLRLSRMDCIKIISDEFKYFADIYRESKRDEFYARSPIPITIVLLFYYLFVTKIGPRLMKHRQPMQIDNLIKVYNLFQVIYLIKLLFIAMKALSRIENWSCMEITYDETEMYLAEQYFFIKLLDLLDTIFFVLRKKNKQISFLHVYHHILMAFMVWVGIKTVPGGHFLILGILNSIVHVFMYSYYLMASISKRQLWWKKYITILQIAQFVILGVHFTVPFFVECRLPKVILAFCVLQAFIMIYLFSKFYYNAYIVSSKTKKV